MENFDKEKFMNALRRYCVILLVGLLFLSIGCLFLFSSSRDIERAEVKGVITRIESESRSFGENTEWEYTVFISYTDLKGITHENVYYPYHDGSMKEGGEVTVLYNIADPMDVDSPNGGFLPYLALGVGAIMVIGSVLIIKKESTNP